MESTGKAAVAEFVATFALVFIAAGSVIVAGPYGTGFVGVALASGFVLAVMVSVTAHVSGGHVNPAVTVGVWVVGRIGTARAVLYIVAQLAGAVFGAFLLRLVVPPAVWKAAHLGTPILATGIGGGKGVLTEAILTFFLVFAVFGTMLDQRGPFRKTAGLTIGLVLTCDILAGGPLTGAAVNPARSFGPALVSGTWAGWWVFWVGPLAGGVIAAVLYSYAFLRGAEPAVP